MMKGGPKWVPRSGLHEQKGYHKVTFNKGIHKEFLILFDDRVDFSCLDGVDFKMMD